MRGKPPGGIGVYELRGGLPSAVIQTGPAGVVPALAAMRCTIAVEASTRLESVLGAGAAAATAKVMGALAAGAAVTGAGAASVWAGTVMTGAGATATGAGAVVMGTDAAGTGAGAAATGWAQQQW